MLRKNTAPERYEKQDEQGNVLPIDSIDHAILIDRHVGLMIDVRKRKQVSHAKAIAVCSKVKLLGRKWRAPTVREAFALADIENPQKAFPKNLYPHFPDFAWIWTSTPYARESNPARPVYAWFVYSNVGLAYFGNRSHDGLALPVSPLALSSGQ